MLKAWAHSMTSLRTGEKHANFKYHVFTEKSNYIWHCRTWNVTFVHNWILCWRINWAQRNVRNKSHSWQIICDHLCTWAYMLFSSLGALILRTWHKPTIAISRTSLCKQIVWKRGCYVRHVEVGWAASMSEPKKYKQVISQPFRCHVRLPRTPRQNTK